MKALLGRVRRLYRQLLRGRAAGRRHRLCVIGAILRTLAALHVYVQQVRRRNRLAAPCLSAHASAVIVGIVVGAPPPAHLRQTLHHHLQVGYIAEYPHTGQAVSAAEGGFSMEQMFWGGKCVELEEGRRVFGQVWPKVSLVLGGAGGARRQRAHSTYVWLPAAAGCFGTQWPGTPPAYGATVEAQSKCRPVVLTHPTHCCCRT